MSGHKISLMPQKVPLIKSRFRRIKTKIPVPESIPVIKELSRYEARSMHGQLPVVWDKAEGAAVFDAWGNRWIDFTSTIFVANAGHSNPEIISALNSQLKKSLLHTYTFIHQGRLDFIKRLIEVAPRSFQKAFLLSSGTEAAECALKLMRMYGQKINSHKKIVISFKGAMHGRTLGAELLKGDPKGLEWIGYADPNILHLEIPFPWSAVSGDKDVYNWRRHFEDNMRELKKDGLNFSDIAGFIIESYVGWSAYFYPVEYIRALADFAKAHKSLLVFDEIQAGFGRTGHLFAYQHYGVEPDLLCLGKGISSSLPLSAVIGRRSIMDLPEAGSMSSTHSANPLCCAAGLANLNEIISKGLVKESDRKGKILKFRLEQIKASFPKRISYVFGKGLVAALLFRRPDTGEADAVFAGRVCEKAMQKGLLLVYTGRESVKIGPPLVISDVALKEGLDVLEESIAEVNQEAR